VAAALHEWLPKVLPYVERWMSSDIPAGARWIRELENNVSGANYGVLCVTPENDHNAWLLYEAGALAALKTVPLCPYLFDYEDRLIAEPLQQFQYKYANRAGTLDLVRTVHDGSETPLDRKDLMRRFNRFWPELEQALDRISAMEMDRDSLGLESVHIDRNDALRAFQHAIDAETRLMQRGYAFRFWVVGSSLRGFLHNALTESWLRLAAPSTDARVLLTWPGIADQRDMKITDGTAFMHDVQRAVATLRRFGFSRERVRYYKASPRTFAIATSRHMLINPYPYTGDAYNCFSIIVAATRQANRGIFGQYLFAHFVDPFDSAEAVPEADWSREEATERQQ